MKYHAALSIIVLLGFVSLSSAVDDPRCMEEYKAEMACIAHDAERAAAANPPGRDIEAQRQFMIPIHEAVNAAVERVRQCEEKSRGLSPRPISAAANLRAKQCIDKADQQIAELRQRTAGLTNLSRGEQAALRDEETLIEEACADCLRKIREGK